MVNTKSRGEVQVFSPKDGCTFTLRKTGSDASGSLSAYRQSCIINAKADEELSDTVDLRPIAAIRLVLDRSRLQRLRDALTPAQRWQNSSIETFHADARSSNVLPCEVVLADGRIAISSDDGEFGLTTYSGREREPGHFEVSADAGGGRGSLHKFAEGFRLDGFRVEDGHRGMWAITLN